MSGIFLDFDFDMSVPCSLLARCEGVSVFGVVDRATLAFVFS